MTSVGDWEFVDIRAVHRWTPNCYDAGHAVGVGWRINRDGQRRLQGWCFTCNSTGTGIKADRPKSEWPAELESVPVVQDNRPPCGGGRIGKNCDPLWVVSKKHALWYRACKRCNTLTATSETWTHPDTFDIAIGAAEVPDSLEMAVWNMEPTWLARLALGSMCQRCGATEDEQTLHGHHTSPRALFPDADAWPVVVLCQPCHSRWHSTVTPGLRRSAAVKAQEARYQF